MHTTQIEQQPTILLRRVQRIHFTTSSGEVELDRSAYGFPAERTGELEAALRAAGLQPSGRRERECDGEATLAMLVTRGSRG